MSIKNKLQSIIKNSLPIDLDINRIVIDIPKDKKNGDYSTNVAFLLTKELKKSPMLIAEDIANNIKDDDSHTYNFSIMEGYYFKQENDTNGESFSDVIGDYIGSGFVIVKDVRGKEKMQIPCYQICYNEYNKKYDWIGFFDADEFLEIEEGTIEDFLNKDIFKNAEGIRVCWKNYDDNDLIKVEGDNYSINRFTRIMDENSIENKRYLSEKSNG